MKDVSIVIVNYNTRKLCEQAIAAIRHTTHKANYEVIVVDNSTDIKEKYTDATHINMVINVENNGFGHACNIGARNAQGKVILFLNSDTMLHDGALDQSVAYLMAHDNIGAIGIKTFLENGDFDHGCRRGFPTPIRALSYFIGMDKHFPLNKTMGGYRLTYLNQDEINEVDAVSGAFLMIPRKLFFDIDGFDESFFMYGEDLDLCYRIKEQGYAVVYYAQASMLHLKGQSGLNSRNTEILYHFYNAMIMFYDKHYKKKYNMITTWLVHFAIKLKYSLVLRKIRSEQC